jgi:LPS sulfotransferase NodH
MAFDEIFNTKTSSQMNLGVCPLDVMQRAFELCPGRTSGFKLIYHHARTAEGPQFGEDDVWGELARQKDVRVIHSVRRNGLARLISWKVAKQSDIWHHFTNRPCDDIVRLEPQECEDMWKYCETVDREIEKDFSGHSLLRMEYADLASDIPSACREMCRFLCLQDHPMKSTLQKRKGRSFDRLENFEELKEQFKGTRWEWFFYDDDPMM